MVATLVAAIVGGCTGAPTATPTGTATGPTATPTDMPTAPSTSPSSTSTSRPSASPRAAEACAPFDLSQQSQPYVLIPGEGSRHEAYGLNGSSVLGSDAYDAGDWHQPPPDAAIPLEAGARLPVQAFLDDRLYEPTCISAMTVDAAPFSPLAIAPEHDQLVRLAAIESGDKSAIREFAVPGEAGEWVVRITLEFDTDPGPSRQDTFFRLLVDVPPPIVDGDASVASGCGKLGGVHDPPKAFLSVEGAGWIQADGGGFSWRGTAGSGPPPNGPRVDAAPGARLKIRIEGHQCANRWRIQIAPRPTGSPSYPYQEPITDLVPDAMRSYDDPPGEANLFHLAEVPPGDWIVRALFAFGRSPDHAIGSTSNFWNVVVPG